MLVIYDSLTGLTKKTALLLDENALSVTSIQTINQPCILLTRSYGFGEIPATTVRFIENNLTFIKGVAVSGNRNWGTNYGAAGDKIQDLYNIPLVAKFEAGGLKQDVETIKKWMEDNE